MTKTATNTLIKNMEKAGIVARATPWMMEAQLDAEYHIRFVGIKVTEDWQSIFSTADNILLKFLINPKGSYVEFYLANKPPFHKISAQKLHPDAKWEILLGELKKQLNKDKEEALKGTARINNQYAKLKPYLK